MMYKLGNNKFKDFQGLENEAIFFKDFQGCGNPDIYNVMVLCRDGSVGPVSQYQEHFTEIR